jgi:hypothetical protein
LNGFVALFVAVWLRAIVGKMGCGFSKAGKDQAAIQKQTGAPSKIPAGSNPNPVVAPAPHHANETHRDVKSPPTDVSSTDSRATPPSSNENGQNRQEGASQNNHNHFENEHAEAHLNSFGNLVDASGGRVWPREYYEARKEADMHAAERSKCFEASKQAYVEVTRFSVKLEIHH